MQLSEESKSLIGHKPIQVGESILRLRPGVHVLDISSEQVHLTFANYTATFTSPPVTQGVKSLIKELTLGGERATIVQRVATTTGLETAFLEYLVTLLWETNCLYIEDSLLDAERQDDLSEFYAYLGSIPSKTLTTLSEAKPLLLAPTAVKQRVMDVLSAARINASLFTIDPGSTCHEAFAQIKAHLTAKPTLLVSWHFPYRLPFARLLNDLAIQARIPVLFGACEGIMGRIGPYVIPGNTACLECTNLRLLSNMRVPEQQAFTQYRASYADLIPASDPTHPVFHDAVLRFFVLEMVRILQRLPPRTIGSLIEHSFIDGTVQRYPIFKAPRCAGCHPGQPERLAWDAHFPAPIVKDAAR